MRVHIGSDHAAYELKTVLVEHLTAGGHEVIDHGPAAYDPDDDYPTYIIPTAEGVRDDEGSLGFVLGGSGNGEQIAANKVKGVRAALGHSVETATLAREHNNARVLGIGARMTDAEGAKAMVDAFLSTPWSNDPRHARRVAMLESYEESGRLPN